MRRIVAALIPFALVATAALAADNPVSCQGASCKVTVNTRTSGNVNTVAATFNGDGSYVLGPSTVNAATVSEVRGTLTVDSRNAGEITSIGAAGTGYGSIAWNAVPNTSANSYARQVTGSVSVLKMEAGGFEFHGFTSAAAGNITTDSTSLDASMAQGGPLIVKNGLKPNTTADTLKQYANGTTWTPTIRGAGTAGTPTYSVQQGRYIRTGEHVSVTWRVSWSAFAGTPTGQLQVTGLPFTNDGIESVCTLGLSGVDVPAGTVAVYGALTDATTVVSLVASTDDGASNILASDAGNSAGTIFGQCSYEANQP